VMMMRSVNDHASMFDAFSKNWDRMWEDARDA